MIFIAHNMAVVKSISDRVMVTYLEKGCEVSPAANMENAVRHP